MGVGHGIYLVQWKFESRVVVAKCSEPQAGSDDAMGEGSG